MTQFRRHIEALSAAANNGTSAMIGLVALCLIATSAYRASDAGTLLSGAIASASVATTSPARISNFPSYP